MKFSLRFYKMLLIENKKKLSLTEKNLSSPFWNKMPNENIFQLSFVFYLCFVLHKFLFWHKNYIQKKLQFIYCFNTYLRLLLLLSHLLLIFPSFYLSDKLNILNLNSSMCWEILISIFYKNLIYKIKFLNI